MDQETREFLQEQFGKIDGRFDEIGRRFEKVDRRFEQIDRRFEKVEQRLETVEEETRQTRVLVEDLTSHLQAVAEGFATVDSRVGQAKATLREELEEDRTRNTQLHGRHERRITDLEERVDLLEGTGD